MMRTGIRKRVTSLAVMTALTVSNAIGLMPLTQITAHAEDSKMIAIVNNGVASNIAGAQASNIYFGNYNQDNTGGKEPIKWRVLQNANKKLFLLSDQNLDAQKYKNDGSATTWADSDLRTWMNNTFKGSAFSDKEASAIAETTAPAPVNPEYTNIPSGGATEDYIFALSINEVTNSDYGFATNYDADGNRVATNTAYVADKPGMNSTGTADTWWLRSPGNRGDNAALANNRGNVYTGGIDVDLTIVAVRPALNINLSSIILTSAANGGKISNDIGADALNKVDNAAVTDWKLTVEDDSHEDFSASRTDTNALAPGAQLTISYSGARTGGNEYVSAIITNTAGTVLYYGNIKQSTSASGTATINIPNDNSITDGCKLYVFQEQCNGDKKTDFSSKLINLTTPDPEPGPGPAPAPKPKSKKTDKDEHHEDIKPAAVNPDTVEGYFMVGGKIVPNVLMGKMKQGPAAVALFKASCPKGWVEAFTFNMATDGKYEYTLKNGILTIIIPKEYRKAGRTFALMGLDKNGKVVILNDTDTNPDTLTVSLNIEGYAFDLIYKD